jgi:NADP-dependent 3-hydroxy acid dehydrogenase YdfG
MRSFCKGPDVSDAGQMSTAMQSAPSRFNRFDIPTAPALAMPSPGYPGVGPDVWRRVLDVDLQAVLLGCQLAS